MFLGSADTWHVANTKAKVENGKVLLGDFVNPNLDWFRNKNSESYCNFRELLRGWVVEYLRDPKNCYFYSEDHAVEAKFE